MRRQVRNIPPCTPRRRITSHYHSHLSTTLSISPQVLNLPIDAFVYVLECVSPETHGQCLLGKIKNEFVYSFIIGMAVCEAMRFVWHTWHTCHKAWKVARRRIAKARRPPSDSKQAQRAAGRGRSKRRRARPKGCRVTASATDGDRAGKRDNCTVIVIPNSQFFDIRVSSS